MVPATALAANKPLPSAHNPGLTLPRWQGPEYPNQNCYLSCEGQGQANAIALASDCSTLLMLMSRRPIHRLTTAFFVVVSLLFSQLALANYVCPGATNAMVMAQMTAAGVPCEGMDQAQPTLCHQHCAGAAQSFEAVKVPVPSLPAIVQVLVVPLVLDAAEAVDVPMAAATSEVHPPPDPLFLSTLRLRV